MQQRIAGLVAGVTAGMLAGLALADEFRPVTAETEFRALVEGRTLSRFGVTLVVEPDGRINGRGMGQPVTGAWSWQGDYFCRDLRWGRRDLAPDCQQVLVNGTRLRLVAERGTGDTADLRLD